MPRPSLDDLIALARAAGREIMTVRAAGFETQTKLDGSIVTIADQRAEKIIEDGLRALAPEIPMIGEEAVADLRIPQCGNLFFCVDPLDGTRGFAKGGDEFTVNIALVEQGAPTMGVVFAPADGALYAGEPERAFRAKYDPNSGAEIEPLTPIRADAGAPARWRIVASDLSGRNADTDRFVAALSGLSTHASSSIKFCRVAEGAADLYPRFGEVSEWDAAAGHAVLSAAGGGIMRLDGSPLRYGDRDGGFIVRGFVAYSNEEAKTAALAALHQR
jgi:3'(2'), 5'-bisphosphate nucleotidase